LLKEEFEFPDFVVPGCPADPWFTTSPPQPLKTMLINPTRIETPISVERDPKKMKFG